MNLDDIKRYQAGDVEAFELLMREEKGRVMNMILRYIRLHDAAEDVFQDAWLQIWHKRGQLRNPAQFRAWMYRIVRNKIFETLRSQNWKNEVMLFGSGHEEWDAVDPAQNAREALHNMQMMRRVNEEMELLEETEREALALRFGSGLKFREIAEVLNMPIGTVTVRTYQALALLAERLRRFEQTPPVTQDSKAQARERR
ncbi:sigma-70 family RNA polymerase sigma factor [Candidatus Sumerlaeota bacterium]|nr:sigma-70 family RNA polymerase sigma factor [Candidatus Sumerlaeota bacterium]